MKQFEIKWQPLGPNLSFSPLVEIVNANSLPEAKRLIEAKAKTLGAANIAWLGDREIR